MITKAWLSGLAFMLAFSWLQEPPQVKIPAEALKPLVGEWKYLSMEVDGKGLGEKLAKARLKVLANGEMQIWDGEHLMVRNKILGIAPQAKPAKIEWVAAHISEYDGKFRFNTNQYGVYRLENDNQTLILCFLREGDVKNRPTEFKSPAGKNFVLAKLERIRK